MLAFRIIAFFALGLLVLVLGGFFWALLMPGAGQVDSVASRRIYQLCGFEVECKVRTGDIFNGDWDTFYEFGEDVPQARIDQVLDSRIVLAKPQQRVLVFVRYGRVVLVKYSPATEKPFEGQIAFESERHREERVVRYQRNTQLRVTAYPVDASTRRNGVYYVLTSIEPEP